MSQAGLFFCIVVLLSISSSAVASPLATVAITRLFNLTVVCALIPSDTAGDRFDVNCTALPLRIQHRYPAGASSYTAIAAGDAFLCALTSPPFSGKTTMKWWDLKEGRAGREPRPKRLYDGARLSELGAGGSHVCALIGDSGEIQCWRWNELPSLRNTKLTSIAIGKSFLCGLSENQAIKCFGNDSNVVDNQPTGRFSLVAASELHACAVAENGSSLTCWGFGAPEVGKIDFEITSLALGDNQTCSLGGDGRVRCWGQGQSTPDRIRKEQFLSIHGRGSSFCGVLTTNFSLICWGSEVFTSNPVVYARVLPGPCGTNCPCGFVPGSGNLCPGGAAICQTCEVEGDPVPVPPPANSTSNSTNYENNNSGGRTRMNAILYVVLGGAGLGLGIAAVGIFLCCREGKWLQVHDSPAVKPADSDRRLWEFMGGKGHGSSVEEIPLQLLRQVTGEFSEELRIGSGSFGAVYRATLCDGREVAIKRAEICSSSQTKRRDDKDQAFLAELAMLSRVNHKNLVRLLGFCSEEGERVLVYEYISNGTLSDHLHRMQCSPLLAWDRRLRAALDAARGIEYLHRYAVPPIIHRDIKSSNILLDELWTAKVSDFGLSLMGPDDDVSHISLRAAGTVGYMDPEYYRLQHLTTKSDVYSFGVVLLELLTGFKAIHQREGEEEEDDDSGDGGAPRNVVDFAVPNIDADRVHVVLDKRVPPPKPSEIEAVQCLAYLAADCVNPEGRNRPTMTEVVSTLERAFAACSSAPPPPLDRSMSTRSA